MQARSEETRNRVIETTISLINTSGYTGTSMDDIIKATGVKKGNLCFHFSSKEELVLQVLERAKDEYFAYLNKAVSLDSPLKNIESLLEAVYRFHKKRNFTGGCIFGNIILELTESNPRISSIAGSALQQWIDLMDKLISDAVSSGEIKIPLTAKTAAEHIVASMEGGIMLARIRKSDEPLRSCMENIYYMLGIKN
jgi:TetR/AcrR family transcriptional repressor of nem operon